MGYTEFILTINSSCITILIILAIILLVATRFRGENGYAAAIIVLPNVPVYIYNMSRMLGWHEITPVHVSHQLLCQYNVDASTVAFSLSEISIRTFASDRYNCYTSFLQPFPLSSYFRCLHKNGWIILYMK